MDVLTDEHEREQLVRKWWSENWKSLALGLVLAVGVVVGVQQYRSYTQHQAEQNAYQMYQIQTKLNLAAKPNFDEANAFIKEHEDIYGSLLALDVAGREAMNENFEEALKLTEFAQKNGGKLVGANATLDTARIQTQMAKYDEALKTLNTLSLKAYDIEKNELLGDIYLVQEKKQEAHDAYKKAIELSVEKKVVISPLLQMKFDSLIKAGETPAFKTAAELQKDIINNSSEIRR